MDSLGNPAPPPEEQTSGDRTAEIQALIDSAHSAVEERQKQTRQRVLVALITVLFLGIAGFGAYWQFFRDKAASLPAAKTPAKTATNQTLSSTPKVPTQPYTSSDFNLSFNYPDGWTVIDSGTGPMTVTSPSLQLTSAAGQTVSGLITMTIQKQGQLPASFSAGTVLAVLNSQRIAYTQPTADQTSQTYLSFVQYASTNIKGGLDAIYVTGNDGYEKGQIIPPSDIASIDPLVTVTFTKCGNTTCTSNLTPLTIASTSWDKSAFQAPLLTMLASLTFQ